MPAPARRCLQRLEALRREKRAGPDRLINYGKRYHEDRPISTSGAESAVDFVIGQRMKKHSHVRWSREGANALLQVRCAVPDGLDVRTFKRWHPSDRRLVDLSEAMAA